MEIVFPKSKGNDIFTESLGEVVVVEEVILVEVVDLFSNFSNLYNQYNHSN